MNNRFNPAWMLLPLLITIAVDIYVFQSLKTSFSVSKPATQRIAYGIYWTLSSVTYIALAILLTKGFTNWHGWSKIFIMGIAQAVFVGKLFIIPFLLVDDILRLFRYAFNLFGTSAEQELQANGISRLQFFSRVGLMIGSTTFGAFFYGIVRGAYNYQKRRVKLPIPNLPDEWKNTKIVQISDLHVGSFADTSAIEKIVRLINEEEADFIFFTGDLVNYAAEEAKPYISLLKNLKAKDKVYSILGNHDYGMYVKWDTEKMMKDNFNELLRIQREELGWDLLMDENRILEKNGKKLAIIGVQYIGHTLRFGSFGNLEKAYSGAENADIQLLLSHDPSHWDKEVSQLSHYKNIHATFSGHTHGFQFGVEIPTLNIKWSPSKYVYPHWAGLYKSVQQHLYVNRGVGFLGYPGRLGISPEITVFELVTA
ncbi:MAG: metallophosphoesterase [Chitinophagales bacterium]